MKTLLIIFAFICSTVSAQTLQVDTLTGKAYLEKTISTPGTQAQLYAKAKAWIFATFKSGNAVLQDYDKEAGRVYGEAVTHNVIYNNIGIKGCGGYFKFSITILVKEGKTKIRIDKIIYKAIEIKESGADIAEAYPHNWSTFQKKFYQKQWDSFREQATPELFSILASYEAAATSPASDNW